MGRRSITVAGPKIFAPPFGLKRFLLIAAGTALALALAAGAALGLGSLQWRPLQRGGPPRLGAVHPGAGPLLAGAAVRALDLPAPAPVAGFARLHWTEEGPRDPIAARALVLQEPGCTLALVSVEILLVPGSLERAVERRLRDLHLDRLVVAATHTHAGPGGWWDEALGERLATGPYSDAIFERLADRIADAVRAAAAALEPAYLSAGRGDATALVRNRGGGTLVDGRLVALRLVGLSGAPLADVVIFPAHATLLGVENRRISGDWPGALMRSREVPTLFFQGALGDQTPRPPPRGAPPTEAYARQVADRLAHVEYGQPDPWPELAVATASVVLPPPDVGASPLPLKRVLRNVFYGIVPDRAVLAALRIGPLTLVAVPGEPVAEVGRRFRAAAGEGAEVLALAGDYLGYVETSERMAEMSGETVRTYYGPELAERLTGAVALAARAVNRDAAPPDAGFDYAASRLRSARTDSKGSSRTDSEKREESIRSP
jgi:neutral ceramidase